MKKLIGEFDIFNNNQIIQIFDTDTNQKTPIGVTTLGNLAITLVGMANDMNIDNIIIEGNPDYAIQLHSQILQEAINLNITLDIEVL